MKKYLLLFAASLYISSVVFGQTQPLIVDETEYNRIDTLQNHRVGPGTEFLQMAMTGTTSAGTSRRLNVYFLKTDLKNEYVEVRTALGRDSIYTGERPSEVARRKSTEGALYFAGTNGDFYATSGYVGYPTGVSVVGGEMAKIPNTSWTSFAIDENKRPAIGRFGYEGSITHKEKVVKINSMNHLRGENELKLYNQYNGATTRTNAYGTELLVELLPGEAWGMNKDIKVKVVAVEKNKGSMAIPDGKAVLSAHGTAADQIADVAVGDEITIHLMMTVDGESPANYLAATGGDNRDMLLKDGVLEAKAGWNEYHPRTALGYTQNRDTLIFLVIDGRGVSAGATSRGIGQLMQSAGAYTAFNMDGGGSSCMYVEGYGKPVNHGSDGSERAVANSIFLVSTAPADETIVALEPHETMVSMPRFGEYTPKFRSYNQYGVLLELEQSGVVLTCPEEMGTIVDGRFVADGTGEGILTAAYNGVTTQIVVKNIPATEVRFRLDSVMIDSRRPYEVEVVAVTEAGELPVSSAAMTWTVDDETVCTVENGVVKALKNGRTRLTGVLDGVSDELLVSVETPEVSPYREDNMISAEWEHKSSSFLKAQWGEDGRPATWEHGSAVSFTYELGLGASVQLAKDIRLFGLPDTVKVILNIGEAKIDRAQLRFRANNEEKYVNVQFTAFEQGKDFTLDVPVDDWFDTADRGIYPLRFNQMQFIPSTSMTAGTPCVLAVKEIVSAYAGIGSASGIASSSVDGLIQVYPNPLMGDRLYVRIADAASSMIDARLYTLSGQCVSNGQYALVDGVAEIPVSTLSQGIYLLRLHIGGDTHTMKIMK